VKAGSSYAFGWVVEHAITACAAHTGITVTHTSAPVPLSITYRAPDGTETTFN